MREKSLVRSFKLIYMLFAAHCDKKNRIAPKIVVLSKSEI